MLNIRRIAATAAVVAAMLSANAPALAGNLLDREMSTVVVVVGQSPEGERLGAGVIVAHGAGKLEILTAGHIAKLKNIWIQTRDGVRANMVGSPTIATNFDVGTFKVELSDADVKDGAFPVAQVVSTLPVKGDVLTVIGHPLGVPYRSMSITTYMQQNGEILADCDPLGADLCTQGDSGAPAFNAQGQVVAIYSGEGKVRDFNGAQLAGAPSRLAYLELPQPVFPVAAAR